MLRSFSPKKALALGPGLALAGATSEAGFAIADSVGIALLSYQGVAVTAATVSPISGIPVAILLGLFGSNVLKLNRPSISEHTAPGLTFATKTVLQAGICCVGTKLSLMDLATTGLIGVPAVGASVAVGLALIPYLGKKAGLSPRMSSLIACGTSICGITAISAVAPAIKADEKESGFAIANVVAFGTAGMLFLPYFAHAVFAPPPPTALMMDPATSQSIGIFLGLSVHDTSQVIGSALTYSSVYSDEVALKAAAVTKLTRNLCLAGVVPYMAVKHSSSSSDDDHAIHNNSTTVKEQQQPQQQQKQQQQRGSLLSSLKKHTPMFVLIFLCASAGRTAGDIFCSYDLLDKARWRSLTDLVGNKLGSHVFLGTAMAAVGYSTKLSALRGVGVAPFVVGAAGSMAVGGTGLMSALLIQRVTSSNAMP